MPKSSGNGWQAQRPSHRRIDRSARGDGRMAFRGEIDYAMLVKIYGVAGKRWEIADIVALIEAKEAEKPLALPLRG